MPGIRHQWLKDVFTRPVPGPFLQGSVFGMWRLIRTFDTRLDLREGDGTALACVLDQYAALMSRAERLLLGRLTGQVWTGGLKVSDVSLSEQAPNIKLAF